MDVKNKHDILNQKAKLDKEFKLNQSIRSINFNANNSTVVIPADYRPKGENIFPCNNTNKCVVLIMRCLSAAAYTIYQTDDVAISTPKAFADRVPAFLSWLKTFDITDSNQIQVIKKFEEYRVNVEGLTPQGSSASNIIGFLRNGLECTEFYSTLSDIEINLLNALVETKLAVKAQAKQHTLTGWFSPHTWLRREDIGIGNELFNHLASPKTLIKSFSVICACSLININKQKYQLIKLIREKGIKSRDLEIPYDRESIRTNLAHHHAHILNVLNENYVEEAQCALKTIFHDFTYEDSRKQSLEKLGGRKSIEPYTNDKTVTSTIESCSPTFDINMIQALCKYVESNDANKHVPMMEAEYWLFTWLMAWQMIQATDIPRLTLRNFRFLRKNNGIATHIECEYYKTRAKVEHTPPMLEVSSIQGEAIHRYLNDKTNSFAKSCMDEQLVTKRKYCDFPITENANLGKLFSLMTSTHFKALIGTSLQKNGASSVFMNAIEALQNNGIEHDDNKLTRTEYIAQTKLTVPALIFSSSHIKTTSVHSRSDLFNPTQLFNYNSHSDETERRHYLSEENEEWLNNCGRITRAVMQDLVTNVLRPSNDLVFNSEFTRATECIDSRAKDSLVRMKLITNKTEGAIVDDLGKISGLDFDDQVPGAVYVHDAPETVMKFKQYLSQVKRKYKRLVKSAPEFLLFSVCPTCEWIENLFDKKKFSKKSITQGEQLFLQYGEHLPELFEAQLRG